MINLSTPSHITLTDYVTRCVDRLCSPFRLNRQFSFSATTAEALIYNDRFRGTSTPPHTHNAIDDPARSLTRVGPTPASTCALMVHRHCMIFHYSRGRPLK